ncbi:hypothetical protein BI308_25965 [Roseofilum reptotaenium AO1-A]|uniref:Uncharacterized protein n=1 Tax=Roseofilum reptotaenium AO1-A TaxID=1925591 RepID=A0A1L9QA74_9CYAN|nr:hypothetical protein BI308_25965 [Roseofilum reptotaenium AO1-A]
MTEITKSFGGIGELSAGNYFKSFFAIIAHYTGPKVCFGNIYTDTDLCEYIFFHEGKIEW